ncbi:Putative transport protein [Collimonas arenae]|uniref:Putative transport protein n=1 Tax=Collimonas arenae TaxID=279058 RepID=A0A0A1F3B3_9BURK|nr:AI-2E family transporter [Collimonas arenae]AIY39223.1 Putative transport protein [Collimonas arenae]
MMSTDAIAAVAANDDPKQDPAPVEQLSAETPITGPLAPFSPHGPTHVRSVCLRILTVLALVFALQWAQKFLIPLVFGIFIAYTLNPLVVWLERIRVPRVFGTCLVMAALVLGLGQVGYSLRGEFQSIMERLPAAAHQLSRAIVNAKNQGGQASTIQKMQAAASEIENAAGQATGVKPDSKRQPPAVVAAAPFQLSEWIWTGSMGAMIFIGQAAMVTFLVFFLLLSGDTFKRKLVKLTGPSLSSKKIAVSILLEINTSIQSYMFMLLVTNALLAVMMWIVFRWIGLENAGAWALAGGFLHIIPYFGPLLIAVATGITAFMQFDSFYMMLLVAASTLVIATLVGTFVTTWMTGRIAKMNAAAVFIVLLFWGWLWGVWGLLLGIPIIVIVKVIAKRVDGLHAVAELLSD